LGKLADCRDMLAGCIIRVVQRQRRQANWSEFEIRSGL
jgi:hypothetical protein